ncbi:VOC family protein [Flavihumibacter rivuli]|uniref:VOC family protein n=1 Tax=Flavihumibacter rivuli TaxID=2838156 RepID=UPI001BDED09E|nr:VOC family protein [Flavihumibacter rivuli]ULQ55938.1 VOC family protein [Flavihumibacter rivuli]
MNQRLVQIAIVVRDYDEAIQFYVHTLGFELVEDSVMSPTKRWVVVRPKGSGGANVLLAKAANPEQESVVGRQTGGRVFLFLHTDDFDRDYERYRDAGVKFIREPAVEDFGKVSVFEDLYGNLWDLIEPR